MREGHWSDLAVHCGLFAGPARSSFVAAYRMDGSQGELSWLAVAHYNIDTDIVMVGHHSPCVYTVCLPDVIALDQLSQAFLPPPYLHTTSSQILAVGTALYHIGKWGDTPIILFAVVTVATGHFDPVY